MFIYIITNTENGKIYIGKTTNPTLYTYLKRKLGEAQRGRQSHLFKAMRKYPKEVWDIHSLISCLTTNWQLNLWEKALIWAFNSCNPEIGYNICEGGEGVTSEDRRRMWTSSEYRNKMSTVRKQLWSDPKFIHFVSILRVG